MKTCYNPIKRRYDNWGNRFERLSFDVYKKGNRRHKCSNCKEWHKHGAYILNWHTNYDKHSRNKAGRLVYSKTLETDYYCPDCAAEVAETPQGIEKTYDYCPHCRAVTFIFYGYDDNMRDYAAYCQVCNTKYLKCERCAEVTAQSHYDDNYMLCANCAKHNTIPMIF